MKLLSNFFIFLVLANVLLFLVYLPFFRSYINKPKQTTYAFVHMTDIDYYLYLSFMRQGADGAWTARAQYTTEPTRPSIFYLYYLVIGKVAKLFHMNLIAAYHLARIVSLEFLFVMIYLLAREVVGKKQALSASLLGFFSSVPPLMYVIRGNILFPSANWWDNVDSLFRVDYLPHHAFGIASLLTALYCLIKLYNYRFQALWFLLGLLFAFISPLVYSPPALVLVIALPAAVGIYVVKCLFEKRRVSWFFIFSLCLLSMVSFLVLVAMRMETQKGFPWSQWNVWDVGYWNTVDFFNQRFVLATGVMLILALPYALYIFQKERIFPLLFVACWAFLPFLLLPFSDKLGIGRIRLANVGQFVAFGILASLTIKKLEALSTKRWVKHVIRYGIWCFFILLTIPSTYYFYQGRLARYVGGASQYIPNGDIEALHYVSQNVPKESVFLATFTMSNILPAFAPTVSYWGHWTQTSNFDQKSGEVSQFFNGTMTPQGARALLKKGRISYVFLDKDATAMGGNIRKYRLPLDEVYRGEDVIIYKVW